MNVHKTQLRLNTLYPFIKGNAKGDLINIKHQTFNTISTFSPSHHYTNIQPKHNTYNNIKSAFHTLDHYHSCNAHTHAGGIVDFASSPETHKKVVNISTIKIHRAKSPQHKHIKRGISGNIKEHVKQRCKSSKLIQQWWKRMKPQLKQRLQMKLIIKLQSMWRGFYLRKYVFDVIYLTLFCQNFVDKLNDVICRLRKKKYFNVLVSKFFYKHKNNTLSHSIDCNTLLRSLLINKHKVTLYNNRYMLMKCFLQYKHKCAYMKVKLLHYITLFKLMERCYYKYNILKHKQLYMNKWKDMMLQYRNKSKCEGDERKCILINRKYKLKSKLRNNKTNNKHASTIQTYFKYQLHKHLYTKFVSLIYHLLLSIIVNTLQKIACMHYLNINANVIKCVKLLTRSVIRKYYTHVSRGLLWIARIRQLKYIGRKVNDAMSNYINTSVFRRWKAKTTDIVNRRIIQIQKCIRKHYRNKNVHAHKRMLTVLQKYLHKLQYNTEMIMVITLRKYRRKCYYIKYISPLITIQKIWKGIYIRKYKYKSIL